MVADKISESVREVQLILSYRIYELFESTPVKYVKELKFGKKENSYLKGMPGTIF